MADVQAQLSKLLGRKVKQVRKTDEAPPRISVIDVAVVITGKDANHAAQDVGYVKDRHPEVTQILGDFKFPGQGQKKTPVTNLRGAVELTFLLPGRHAAQVRRKAAELLCRYLGGDLTLVDEVCALRSFQDELAVEAPADPRRLFGEAVEASSSSSDPSLARVLSHMNERLKTQEQLLARIQANLEHDRQHVNLNVRAPKRAGPHLVQMSRDIGGTRPFPVARFLDMKEQQDPGWKCARRSYAPTFGMQVQVLKKNKLKEQGQTAIYVEQNSRPQLLYTDEDRPLMEEAWTLTAAHREDLTARYGNPPQLLVAHDAPAVLDRPERQSVMDLLQRSRE